VPNINQLVADQAFGLISQFSSTRTASVAAGDCLLAAEQVLSPGRGRLRWRFIFWERGPHGCDCQLAATAYPSESLDQLGMPTRQLASHRILIDKPGWRCRKEAVQLCGETADDVVMFEETARPNGVTVSEKRVAQAASPACSRHTHRCPRGPVMAGAPASGVATA
jgi:hypothetical protein